MKKTVLLGSIMAGAMALAPSAMAAPSIGGCQLDGNAAFGGSGLGIASSPFTYSFDGTLTNCKASDTSGPAGGSVSAGETIALPDGTVVNEPAATGSGGCGTSTTAGTAIVVWSDNTVSVIDYSTTGAAAAVGLQGKVVPSENIGGVTVTSTRYAGDTAGGLLAFQPASPTDCQTGVKAAGIHGVIGTGSAS